MLDISRLPFTQQMQTKEVLLRGLYMSISSDIEYILIDIIAKCEIDNPTEREAYKLKFFGNNAMGKKVEKAKRSLKEYNHSYYTQFEGCFQFIDALLERRNMFAHSKINGDDINQDNTVLIFEYIDKGRRIIETKQIAPLFTELHGYRDTIMLLAQLVIMLSQERGVE